MALHLIGRIAQIWGGGIILYVRDDIPSKELKTISLSKDKEYIFIEINLYKKKWLIVGFYNPCKNQIKNQTIFLSKNLDYYLYDNIIILVDFNTEPKDKFMNEFINMYGIKTVFNESTCYKNVSNPSCIDLILTNRTKSFQNTTAIETGLSDFHKTTITIIQYRYHKNFSNIVFRSELMDLLYIHNVNNIHYNDFDNLVMGLQNNHAPIEYKYILVNEATFVNKE